jgi:glycosyltransferase involved in cell wall biosynthesis
MKDSTISSQFHYGLVLITHKIIRILRHEGLTGLGHRLKRKIGALMSINGGYTEWIRRYDTLDQAKRNQIRDRILELSYQPLISVVMPVYNPPIPFLEAAIHSVQDQLYPHWELCIADDASTNPEVQALLSRYAEADARIKVIYRKENGHISVASNSALELATGEFVTLLDHDDELSEHALYCIVEAINQHPRAGIIYSDEDKIDASGKRFDPYFKCDFNYELFLAQNMISHLGVYRRTLLEEIGGFRTGYEGSQDYDLALRALEKIEPTQIVHVPHVLYHWRAIPGSTARNVNEKNYAVEAAHQAVQDHLQRCDIEAIVSPAPESPEYHRVQFRLPAGLPLVSIIIPTRDRADLLDPCIDSILNRSSYPHFEIVVIDNGSVEPATTKLFDRLPTDRVRVVRDDSPFNFSALNNYGAQKSKGELLCLMNNDIEISTPDWLEEMVSFAHRADIGCVGARLWYPNGLLQHGGVITGVGGVAGHAHLNLLRGDRGYFNRAVLHQSFSAVTAACLVIRRSVFEQVGGLDESLAVAYNDVDFCLRVREAGYRNVWTPYAEMVHHESATRGYETTPAKQARLEQEMNLLRQRWGEQLFNDPAYSPNLNLKKPDFAYAFPPRNILWR